MEIVKTIVSLVLGLASLVCWIIIIVEMFKDEIWKGIVGLICWLYALYYGLFEFDHEYRWPIFLVAVFGGAASTGIRVF